MSTRGRTITTCPSFSAPSVTRPTAVRSVYDRDLAYVHHLGFSDFARAAAPVVLELLRDGDVKPGSPVVDLGCGSGVLAGELSMSGYVVTGVDISPEMVALARKQVTGATFVHLRLRSAPPSLPSARRSPTRLPAIARRHFARYSRNAPARSHQVGYCCSTSSSTSTERQ